MDDFRIIYKILRILQKSMDMEEFDKSSISAEILGLSIPKWNRIMAMLLNEGYIYIYIYQAVKPGMLWTADIPK